MRLAAAAFGFGISVRSTARSTLYVVYNNFSERTGPEGVPKLEKFSSFYVNSKDRGRSGGDSQFSIRTVPVGTVSSTVHVFYFIFFFFEHKKFSSHTKTRLHF